MLGILYSDDRESVPPGTRLKLLIRRDGSRNVAVLYFLALYWISRSAK